MSERSAVEVLRAARERIADPARWYQGEYACDSDGSYIAANSDLACKWCAAGAVLAELDRDMAWGEIATTNALTPLVAAIKGHPLGETLIEDIATFNDDPDREHAEVLAVFDRAIEWAERNET